MKGNKQFCQANTQFCKIHPDNQIDYVCLRSQCSQTFFCNDCFRSDTHFNHLDKIFQIDEILDCDDLYDLTHSIFQQGDMIDENKILEDIILFKEKIIQQLDIVQKALALKLQNYFKIKEASKKIVEQFQIDISLFCCQKLSNEDAEQKVQTLIENIQQNQRSSNQIFIHKTEFNEQQKQILEGIKKLEQFVVESKQIIPQINQIPSRNNLLLFEYQRDILKILGYKNNLNHEGNTNHSFKFEVENTKSYSINFSIYKTEIYEITLQFVYPNYNFEVFFLLSEFYSRCLANGRHDQCKFNQICKKCHCSSCGKYVDHNYLQKNWLQTKQSLDDQISFKNSIFQLKEGKNDYTLQFNISKQQIFLKEANENVYNQMIFPQSFNSNQQGYFTFSANYFPLQNQSQQQLQDYDLIQILDFNAIQEYQNLN